MGLVGSGAEGDPKIKDGRQIWGIGTDKGDREGIVAYDRRLNMAANADKNHE